MDAFWNTYDQKNVEEIAAALARLVAEREGKDLSSDFRIVRDDGKLVAEAQTADLAADVYSKLANFSTHLYLRHLYLRHLYLSSKRVAEMASGQKIRVRKPKAAK